MSVFDISPLLEPAIAVWPGDRPFRREESLRLEDGDPVNLSSIQLSLHTGAHADAPSHYAVNQPSIDRVPLERYWGEARVVTLPGEAPISAGDLQDLPQPTRRLLLKAHPDFDPRAFPAKVRHFTVEAAQWLAEARICLVGIDAPSVDPLESRELAAHHIFGKAGIAILENLNLAAVPDGVYELSALPLRIAGGDASPVRAALRRIEGKDPG